MLQFLCVKTPLGHLHSIHVYSEDEHIEVGVAAEIAKFEGYDVEVFLGTDLVDVMRSHEAFFEEPRRAAA